MPLKDDSRGSLLRALNLVSPFIWFTSDREIDDVKPREDTGEDGPEYGAVSLPRADDGNRGAQANAGVNGIVCDGYHCEHCFIHSLNVELYAFRVRRRL